MAAFWLWHTRTRWHPKLLGDIEPKAKPLLHQQSTAPTHAPRPSERPSKHTQALRVHEQQILGMWCHSWWMHKVDLHIVIMSST